MQGGATGSTKRVHPVHKTVEIEREVNYLKTGIF